MEKGPGGGRMFGQTARLALGNLLPEKSLAGDGAQPSASEQLTCFVTDEARVVEVGARFLGRPLAGVQLVDL